MASGSGLLGTTFRQDSENPQVESLSRGIRQRSRGDLRTFLGQSFPARPGQGDGAGPCRRRAGRAIPQRRIARRLVVRSGLAKGRGNRGKIVTRRAEICGPNGPCPRVDPLARDETAGGAPGGQGRAARKARGVGRCSRRTSRARSWARVSSSDCTRSRAIRICPNAVSLPTP